MRTDDTASAPALGAGCVTSDAIAPTCSRKRGSRSRDASRPTHSRTSASTVARSTPPRRAATPEPRSMRAPPSSGGERTQWVTSSLSASEPRKTTEKGTRARRDGS